MDNGTARRGRIFSLRALLVACMVLLSSPTLLAERTKNLQSVVALSKSVAEMWLLAGGKLSGTTSDALELTGASGALSVGTLTTASLEAIVSLRPDLVILTKDIPLHKKLNANLHSLGIRTYIADVKKFSDYERVMADFTVLTGRSDLYKKNVDDVKGRIKKIIGQRQGPEGKTYIFLRVSSAKNKVLKDHFGNEIFNDLGLRSITCDNSSLDEISMEALAAADPDYIFVVAQGNQENADKAFFKAYKSSPAWQSLKAVRKGNVHILPKELFNYKPNARWAESYEFVKNLL